MKYYVNRIAARNGDGTKEKPFQTINQAAKIARAGDEVIVAPGVYREYVNPVNAGEEGLPIVYRSEVIGGAVITGAEVVKNWEKQEGNVWMSRISNGIFGSYNPYIVRVKGDWYNESNPKPVHTGEVYLNNKAMYEYPTLVQVQQSVRDRSSWDPEGTLYAWYTMQDDADTLIYANFQGADPNAENVEINVRRNCFYPDKTGVNYITLSGFVVKQAATQWAPPTAYQEGMVGPHWSRGWIIEDCEISDSRCSGISLGKYLQPNNENKWTTRYYKDGTQNERDAICQAQNEGWTKENIGHHIVRRCNIHDCGQTGIVGHLGGVFSIIEDNHIHHINNKQDLAGAEIGGIKMHAAIDVTYRRNHIHHCTRGLWLDWQAQGTRVTQNLFHDNVPPKGTVINNGLELGEDVFIEVSHGPTLIDNNLLLSNCSARISTQGIAFVHNLIAGSFTWVGGGSNNDTAILPSSRFTPYHVPHRTEVAGFMTILHGDVRFYNNIFVQQKVREDLLQFTQESHTDVITKFPFCCGLEPYNGYPTETEYKAQFTPKTITSRGHKDFYYDHMPVYVGGNVYFNGARPWEKEEDFREDTEHKITWELKEMNGEITLETNLYDYVPSFNTPFVSTELLGEAFEPEQKFENPDGTPIFFDSDYQGAHRGIHPIAGPFGNRESAGRCL